MKCIIGIIFLIIGLVVLGTMSIKEKDIKTHWKIMIAASSGAFVAGGTVLLILV